MSICFLRCEVLHSFRWGNSLDQSRLEQRLQCPAASLRKAHEVTQWESQSPRIRAERGSGAEAGGQDREEDCAGPPHTPLHLAEWQGRGPKAVTTLLFLIPH